jgi:hypothetical protein
MPPPPQGGAILDMSFREKCEKKRDMKRKKEDKKGQTVYEGVKYVQNEQKLRQKTYVKSK